MTGPEVKTNIATDDFDPSHLRGARLGRYELLVGIGKGGMASVWVGRDTTGKQSGLVAIKVIRGELASEPKARTMFLVEGALVAAIRHKHVVRVYEVSQYEGVLYMVMEWVEGSALHALISEANKRRAIPPEHAVRLIADTAGGLHAAHEMRDPKGVPREVVHCDVSPQNILVGLDGTTKLVDFGVASAVGRLNTQGAAPWVRGKVGYMSPEQTRAETLDRRSDIFSLGIVLFELTTGYRLFRGKDNRQTVELVRQARIPRPTQTLNDYPKSLEAVVLKALQRDPARRFQSADEFKAALEQYLRDERIVVAPAGVGGLVKRVLGPRIEHHRVLIEEAMTALDAGPEARAKWLATPPSPGPQAVKSPVTETSSSVQRTGSPIPPEPAPVAAPRKGRLMTKSQVYWTLWAMCIAALSVYAWWLY
jgi:eukaryotic-like serine/threonine-protein kinase